MLETGNRVMQARSEVVPEKPSGPSTHPGLTQKNSGNGSTISFHHIHYSVQVKPPGRKCGTVPTEILHDINGIFKPGMNGILGPTGGGKSSLLDILAGRKNPAGLEGLVLVDGHLQPDNFKCMTGYVVQDDVVMGTLTVRENFMFSANLRLPKSVKRKEKEARVEDTIVELGLTKCADSKVGTEFIRGVSGGERKRTNIGMELIISPSVLFLDEPTTGLDASTANAVMALLYKLSRRGRTIIFSIHQPRYSIFKFFDRLMLLGAGRTIYHGPAAEALQYFSEIGYQCEEHNNPPDFFLDVINGDSTAVLSMDTKPALPAPTSNAEPTADYDDLPIDHGRQPKPHVNGSNGIDKVESPPDPSDESGDKKSEPSVAMVLSDKYMNSSHYKSVCSEIGPIEDEYKQRVNQGTEVKIDKGEYVTSFLTQLRYVSKRTILNLIRNPQSSVLQLVIMIIFSVLVGIIYLQIGDDLDGGIQNRIGAFFFIIMNQVFGNLSAVELFIKERSIFIHESASGFYRISAYFFAKLFCDLIPMRIVPLTFFCVIAYFMVGFQMVAAKFFIFYLTLFLTTMAASGVSFAISASVGIFAIANLLIAFCYVIMMVFGGLLVNLKTMGDWLSWLQYLSIIRYSLNSLSVNELKDLTLYQTTINGTRIPVKTAGTQYLDLQGIKYATDWDFWQNIMALGIIAVGMMIIAYIQLRRIPKLK